MFTSLKEILPSPDLRRPGCCIREGRKHYECQYSDKASGSSHPLDTTQIQPLAGNRPRACVVERFDRFFDECRMLRQFCEAFHTLVASDHVTGCFIPSGPRMFMVTA